MAINFVVEDGTGTTDATSYVAVADYKQYWLDRGITITSTDDQIKAYLNRATEYIDTHYVWKGEVFSTTQALQWPRNSTFDRNGNGIGNDTIPAVIKHAVCIVAYAAPSLPSFEIGDDVSSKSIGNVSVSYRAGTKQRRFPAVDISLKHLVISRGLTVIRT